MNFSYSTMCPFTSYNKFAEWNLFALCVLPVFTHVLFKSNIFKSDICNLDNSCLYSTSNLRNCFVMGL